jgi:CspA family cold shock protein
MKWFNSQKGYGFIQPQEGGKDVFVHISAVERAGLTGLNEGQSIEYEVVSNRGKSSAENTLGERNLTPPASGVNWSRCDRPHPSRRAIEIDFACGEGVP